MNTRKGTAICLLATILLIIATGLLLRLGSLSYGTQSSMRAGGSDLLGHFVRAIHKPIPQLLLQLVVIVAAARLVGRLFERFNQPPVVGEMLAGIALGPSLVGNLFPSLFSFVFPNSSMGGLQMLSQIGIVIFLFVVGIELDIKLLTQRARAAVLISQLSIALPFCAGVGLALLLYRSYAPRHAAFIPFALLIGVSMSITAFPVLARIIKEKGLSGSSLGATMLSCAAVDDATAWCLLAFVVALGKAQSLTGAALTVVLAVAYVFLMFLVVRPLLERISGRAAITSTPSVAITVVYILTLFTSALLTEAIGIHALFGAFIAGVVMPKHDSIRSFLQDRLEYFSSLILVPVFFAFTGLRTQVGLLGSTGSWLILIAVMAAAVGGKFLGSMAAARLSGMPWKECVAVGAMMNTRGLVELIALNVGLDMGLLSPSIFTMLVIMSLVTTFATGPIINWLGYGKKQTAGNIAQVPETA